MKLESQVQNLTNILEGDKIILRGVPASSEYFIFRQYVHYMSHSHNHKGYTEWTFSDGYSLGWDGEKYFFNQECSEASGIFWSGDKPRLGGRDYFFRAMWSANKSIDGALATVVQRLEFELGEGQFRIVDLAADDKGEFRARCLSSSEIDPTNISVVSSSK